MAREEQISGRACAGPDILFTNSSVLLSSSACSRILSITAHYSENQPIRPRITTIHEARSSKYQCPLELLLLHTSVPKLLLWTAKRRWYAHHRIVAAFNQRAVLQETFQFRLLDRQMALRFALAVRRSRDGGKLEFGDLSKPCRRRRQIRADLKEDNNGIVGGGLVFGEIIYHASELIFSENVARRFFSVHGLGRSRASHDGCREAVGEQSASHRDEAHMERTTRPWRRWPPVARVILPLCKRYDKPKSPLRRTRTNGRRMAERRPFQSAPGARCPSRSRRALMIAALNSPPKTNRSATQ